jgi:hypothetical protein
MVKSGGIALKIEAVIRGQLLVAVGDKSDLGGSRALGQCKQPRIAPAGRCERIAFDVELDAIAADRGQ